MGLEAATYINQLIGTNPTGSDPASSADDHLRLIKSALLNTFPNLSAPVTASAATLNVAKVTQGGGPGQGPNLISIGWDGVSSFLISVDGSNYGPIALANTHVLQAAPPSEVAFFARSSAPTGWLKCNGAAVSRTTYAVLFANIGIGYGAGDGSTTFNLPDMRGLFARGWDDGRGFDPGRAFGNYQASQNLWHSHGATDTGHTHTASSDSQGLHAHSINDPLHSHTASGSAGDVLTGGGSVGRAITGTVTTSSAATGISINNNGAHSHNISVASGAAAVSIAGDGGDEARSRNMSLLACIKY